MSINIKICHMKHFHQKNDNFAQKECQEPNIWPRKLFHDDYLTIGSTLTYSLQKNPFRSTISWKKWVAALPTQFSVTAQRKLKIALKICANGFLEIFLRLLIYPLGVMSHSKRIIYSSIYCAILYHCTITEWYRNIDYGLLGTKTSI